ncbi:MAG TPA: tetratricopeptide repeat protein, partial [Permianibacter sp.]|nr:tetratricopeptide repeat protein [Permianibacter sp.]
RGESTKEAIFLPVLRDVGTFLQLGGFSVIGSYFDLGSESDAVFYVALVNDASSSQRKLHFDVTSFMHSYFTTAFEAKGKNKSEIVGMGLRAMADGADDAAQVTVGDMLLAYYEGQEYVEKALSFYQLSAQQGNVYAMSRLARRYFHGDGVKKDPERALNELARAAEKGFAGAEIQLAQLYDVGILVDANEPTRDALLESAGKKIGEAEVYSTLASLYQDNEGFSENDERAFFWTGRAANLGHASAIHLQALMWEFGIGTPKDEKRAVAGYQRAANLGNAAAMASVGRTYREGAAVEKSEKLAFEWFQKAEQAGSGYAAYELSSYYFDGQLVEKNANRGLALVRTAADRGYAEAMCRLGYLLPKTTTAQREEAFQWYLKGARRGQGWCAYNLGWEFSTGKNVPRSDTTAFQWFSIAADRGYIPAFATVGWMLKLGEGTPVNYAKALEYLKKGAEAKHPLAITNLASMYYEGLGVARDYVMAFQLYAQAAEAKDRIAQRMLGRMYRDGLGVTADLALAKTWLQRAADQGDNYAQNDLRQL